MSLENMKVEDRLAEKLKSADFAQWFGEDDLRELTGKALERAFFKDRDSNPGNYNNVRLPPILVELAQKHVNEIVDKLAVEHIKKLFADDPSVIERIMAKAVDKTLEDVVTRAIAGMIGYIIAGNDFNMQERIRQALGRP